MDFFGRVEPTQMLATPDGCQEAWRWAHDEYEGIARRGSSSEAALHISTYDPDLEYRVPVVQTVDGTAVLDLRGPLDDWLGVRVDEVIRELNRQRPRRLLMRIASPGGAAEAGLDLAAALWRMQQPPSTFTGGERAAWGMQAEALVEGLCASAALLPLLAVPVRRAPAPSRLMMHAPSTIAIVVGARQQARRQWEEIDGLLRHIEDLVLEWLVARTTADEAQRAAWMDGSDHWMSAQQALEVGFLTEVLSIAQEPDPNDDPPVDPPEDPPVDPPVDPPEDPPADPDPITLTQLQAMRTYHQTLLERR